jgi:hypothetical protein
MKKERVVTSTEASWKEKQEGKETESGIKNGRLVGKPFNSPFVLDTQGIINKAQNLKSL